MTEHENKTTKALTKNQVMVLDVLSKSNAPLTAYGILDLLRDDGFRAPPQVYRALEKLCEFGMVHRLEGLNAFVACSHSHCQNGGLAAFAICEKCGEVREFTPAKMSNQLEEWANSKGFAAKKTTIELSGLCKACNQ
jgi:Fur family zinc uptake transcriptional regulator